MSQNFIQLKASLRSWLGDLDEDQLPDLVAGEIINIVRRETLRLYDLSFGETADVFITSPQIRDYAKPAGFRPFSLWYSHPTTGEIITLRQLDKGTFDDTFPGSGLYGFPTPMGAGTFGQNTAVLGDPTAYTMWGRFIQLGKVPTTQITIFRNFYGLGDDLTDAAPEDGFTLDAWEFLLFKGLVKAAEFGFEREQVADWEREASRMEQQLVIEHGRAGTMGIRPQSEEPG